MTLTRDRLYELKHMGSRVKFEELIALCDIAIEALASREAGNVVVPREPTEAMALNAIEKCHLSESIAKLHHVKEIYRAMISATEPRG